MFRNRCMLALIALSLLATPAFAHVGPGFGFGAIASVFGVIGAAFLFLFALIWYPFKKLYRRFKSETAAEPPAKRAGE